MLRLPFAGGRIQRCCSSARRYIPFAMIAGGVAILLFVATQYARTYVEQSRLAKAWEQQQHRPASDAQDGLTRLSIPKINLSAIVVEGTSKRDLLLGPGHVINTALPGQDGNAVLTAHRDTFFRRIYELNKGDLLNVQRDGKTYQYEVTSKKIVSPTDVSVLHPSSEKRLTLITCYPTYYIGPAPKRLVVFSRMLDLTTLSESNDKAKLTQK